MRTTLFLFVCFFALPECFSRALSAQAQNGGGPDPEILIVDYDVDGNPIGVYVPLNGVLNGPNLEAKVVSLFSERFSYSEAQLESLLLQIESGSVDAAFETELALIEGRQESGCALITIGTGQLGATVANPFYASDLAFELESDLLLAGVNQSQVGYAMKTFVLDKKRGGKWGPRQAYVYVEDQNGNVFYPDNGTELESVLDDLNESGTKVKHLIIKGHASDDPPLIEVGEDGDILTVANGDVVITNVDDPNVNIDITDELNEATDATTNIDLRGCSTSALAEDLDGSLGGEPTVSGSTIPVIGIPWSNWTIGPYADF